MNKETLLLGTTLQVGDVFVGVIIDVNSRQVKYEVADVTPEGKVSLKEPGSTYCNHQYYDGRQIILTEVLPKPAAEDSPQPV